ncbi:MAG: hypothetical protein J3Q66DRAFT_373775 [Benniella sp.]|nr:MAG: hypothetical protein J3Q66DRAFT_373775 [Benniella sp.]
MLRSISPPISLTLLTFIFAFIANVSLYPSVNAQSFRPAPAYRVCSAFAEGQGLYIIGGVDTASQSFMLDLSVSWNVSAPVFKDLSPTKGPNVEIGSCAMTNNGGDLFVLTLGTGYIYNVASNSWRPFSNPNFPAEVSWGPSATDPATGIIYFSDSGTDWAGNMVTIAVDLKTSKVTTSKFHEIDTDGFQAAAWSTPSKGMIVFQGIFDPIILNPAKMNTTSKGWSTLPTTGMNEFTIIWNCAVPAYNGTKIILFGDDRSKTSFVYFFDTVKRSWKKGLTNPGLLEDSACAVTGDQFIIWGGKVEEEPTDKMLIYNLKTNTWVTSYTAPPRNTTATTTTLGSLTSGPSPTSSVPSANETQEPSANSSSSNEIKYVIIIVAVTAVLMSFLGFVFAYFQRAKRSNSGDQDASPNGSNGPNGSSSRLRAPTESNLISGQTYAGSIKDQKWHDFGDEVLSSPHAILREDLMTLRTAQEGVVEVMTPPQHPHAVIDKNSNTTHSINEWNRGDKYEWDEDN